MSGKVRIEKRCICGEELITAMIPREEADKLGREWEIKHTGPGHRKLSEEAYNKLIRAKRPPLES